MTGLGTGRGEARRGEARRGDGNKAGHLPALWSQRRGYRGGDLQSPFQRGGRRDEYLSLSLPPSSQIRARSGRREGRKGEEMETWEIYGDSDEGNDGSVEKCISSP